MSWHVIEPRDPLMVRDGRPFGSEGADAYALDFPPPSVTAGTLRTRIWHAKGGWNADEAKRLPVRGPILAEFSAEKEAWQPFLHAPRDCVFFDAESGDNDKRLRRFTLSPEDAVWPDGTSSLQPGLLPVGASLPDSKPAKEVPAFWSAETLKAWLQKAPAASDRFDKTAGRKALQHERRTHVAIEPDTGTGADGKLFQTDGLRFAEFSAGTPGKAGASHRLGLLVECQHGDLRPGVMTLGGERRVSLFGPLGGAAPVWAAPDLRGKNGARVVLLTPALFRGGGVPSHIGGARVVAAAVGRPQAISGWDMTWRSQSGSVGGPKRVRRMAPAGSVYWVDLAGQDPQAWAGKVHFQSVSEETQDQLDGFGLAAVGVWR